MKTIYIDDDYKCHLADNGSMIAIETDFFDDKCDFYIEGFRYIPDGKTWINSDGYVLKGETYFPWKSLIELLSAQQQYEFISNELNASYQEGINSI